MGHFFWLGHVDYWINHKKLDDLVYNCKYFKHGFRVRLKAFVNIRMSQQ